MGKSWSWGADRWLLKSLQQLIKYPEVRKPLDKFGGENIEVEVVEFGDECIWG